MATQPDLTLPPRAPSVGKFHDQPSELRPAALYTLISLSDADLAELQDVCERDTLPAQPGVNIRLAPRPRFVGEDLRAIFDYHLQLGNENVFDPIYFLVAIDKHWKNSGVLIVTLDDDDFECKTDKFCSYAQDAGLTIVNLQISNVDWSEAKEEALPFPGEGGDDDNKDTDGEEGESDDRGYVGDDDDSPEVPKGPPLAGSSCGLYVVEGGVAEDVLFNLMPGGSVWATYQRSKWPVSLQGVLSPSIDPVDQAFALHPSRCRRNKWLEKDLFFVADTIDPIENGMLLCQLSERRTQRTPLNAVEGLQKIYFEIRNGTREWSSNMPLFLLYRDELIREVPTYLLTKDGGRTQAIGNISAGKRLPFGKVDEAVRWFPLHCRQYRFKDNLQKNYFICIPEDWEKGVLLVHLDWDGNVSRPNEEMMALDLAGKAESFRCPIDEAYAMLKDIVEGKHTWPIITGAVE